MSQSTKQAMSDAPVTAHRLFMDADLDELHETADAVGPKVKDKLQADEYANDEVILFLETGDNHIAALTDDEYDRQYA